MNKPRLPKIVCAAMILALGFASCEDFTGFFRTSLAPESNRIARAEPRNAAEAQALVDNASPGDARRILEEKLPGLIESAEGAEKAALQGVAAEAAIKGGNVGGVLAGNAGNIDLNGLSSGGAVNYDAMISLAHSILGDIGRNEGDKVAGNLAVAITGNNGGIVTKNGKKVLNDGVISSLGTTQAERDAQLGLLAATLLFGSLNPDIDSGSLEKGFVDGGGNFDPGGVKAIIPSANIEGVSSFEELFEKNPRLALLDAVVNSMGNEPGDPLSSSFRNLWKCMKGE